MRTGGGPSRKRTPPTAPSIAPSTASAWPPPRPPPSPRDNRSRESGIGNRKSSRFECRRGFDFRFPIPVLMSDAALATAEPVSDVRSAPRAVPRPRRRILVTGAAGMLGSDLVPVLAGAGHDVFARSRSDLDITKEKDVALAFREIRPHVVVNCAAFTRVDDCESEPRALEVNARGVHRLAEHSLRHAAQLVQIST